MNPQAILMNPPMNAYAAWYALSPAERVSAAVRLIRLLKRERKRVLRLFIRSIELDIRFGCDGGNTSDINEHLYSLTQWVVWLERRYGLHRNPATGPILDRLRHEERRQIPPADRIPVPLRVRSRWRS